MQYVSTRGGMAPSNFSDVLLEGLAPDGGLVVPVDIPTVDAETIESWRELTYPQLATEVIGLYWTDIPRADLAQLCQAAYGDQFNADDVVPLTPIDQMTALVDLSQGPTLAFKDMAMQFLGEALPYVLKQRDQTLNILGATSGDTGSAAEYAFRSKPNIGVFMLSPKGRMSQFQRAQMYTLTDDNIHNIVIDGVFDDAQNLVKELNGDLDFKAKHSLGTVNSINLGRLIAQSVYYFWAWLRVTTGIPADQREGFGVSFAVPSGNFGNVFSGQLARQMGLPIDTLVLATNENNVLDEFFRSGKYEPRSAANTLATSSPSMDISKASNLERFIYLVLGQDADALAQAWEQLDSSGTLDLSEHQPRFQQEFGMVSGTSTHQDRVATIRATYEKSKVVIDPHTADGVTVARGYQKPNQPMLVLETAKPEKFTDIVNEALGFEPELLPEYAKLLELEQHTVQLGTEAQALREYIALHHV
ncbi:MAG TPA: threonine synthase [Enteractinococcus helveticum]|uniref:Threonine synthase n=1 Tax=Enteractinococcus helveticum TaxID=1837282 RepID=A0A921FLT7_9MICC|nr:threonine synthase [Enteractinococcus helveticum]HJF14140.1 threonine synthase [Enteractinococcus helveticum]